MRTGLRRMGHGAAILLPLALAACQTLIKPPCGDDGCPKSVCDPKVLTKPTMHAAASDLDHLEKHIDWHGSVAAKVPDVWGQARLTLYREQFEEQMVKDLASFKESLQGSIARQDQAFLLNATALSASLETPVRGVRSQVLPAGRYLRRDTSGNPLDPTNQDNIVVLDKDQTILIPPANPPANPPAAPAIPGLVVETKNGTTTSTAGDIGAFIDRDGLKFQNNFLRQTDEKLSLALEPERYLEQKKRYLDLLAQIRRTNEGDDTADSPGYDMRLFRIPVSVLPGKHTDTGHGAEITMTLTPVLGEDLLPTTFRNLVINDLVDQLGFPLTKFLDSKEARDLLTPEYRWIVRNLPVFEDAAKAETLDEFKCQFNKIPLEVQKTILKNAEGDEDLADLYNIINVLIYNEDSDEVKKVPIDKFNKSSVKMFPKDKIDKRTTQDRKSKITRSYSKITTTFRDLSAVKTPFSPGTRNRQAMPSSQYVEVYGAAFAFEVAFKANQALGKQIATQGYAHLPDVQAFLKQELEAGYQLLAKASSPETTKEGNHDLLEKFCTPALTGYVRNRDESQLYCQREIYRSHLNHTKPEPPPGYGELDKDPQFSTTAALAWALIVDSALLTDRLVADMKETASSRGVALPHCGVWLDYYRPNPSPDARQAFNAYVAARWPVHVFALDPAVQEQNLADRLSTRRELQLALSLAFSHGFMNFNQLTRYARRLEAEYETIDVNRTQVGFAHGSDTFGWRFYPRYQTPDTPGNITVIARDLIAGGPNKNQLLRQRRLEPGPRECVAMVIMPSFVPAVTLNTTSNFFGLANPKHKVFDHTQAVKLGKTVQAIKNTGCGLTDANCYRDGDAARLIKRAEQLEARLPMQTVTFPVPTEGSLGGFQLFSNSTTDLAPELYGWYGAPGASATKSTTLFLVGNHFSPLRTRVIVGNREVSKGSPTKMTLLSRQVMQVDFGPDLIPLNGATVAVHVATPYGVSRELLVPVVNSVQPDGYYLTNESKLNIGYSTTADKVAGPYTATFGAVTSDPVMIAGRFAPGTFPKTIKVDIAGVSGSATATADTTGTYKLDGADFQALVHAWFNQFTAKPFDSTADFESRFPTGVTLRVTPEGGTSQEVYGVLRVTAFRQAARVNMYQLAKNATVELDYTFDSTKGTVTASTKTVSAAIQAPPIGALAIVKVGIADGPSTSVEVKFEDNLYKLDNSNFGKVVSAWATQALGKNTTFKTDADVKDKIPKSLTLVLIPPDGRNNQIVVGNILIKSNIITTK
ncbi:hypothetical protein J8F10_33725 [Gemmata sp. G18]|uniref:Uncharacterized protein n=1 Tax=Gemmata palustris TaxID=2822762 RepID=A0ABS5C2N1_9BACT|nr:hypothetical protein [Gemmata palustris]MBP3960214.1 hypothetical protein [Gemmata palustris]